MRLINVRNVPLGKLFRNCPGSFFEVAQETHMNVLAEVRISISLDTYVEHLLQECYPITQW